MAERKIAGKDVLLFIDPAGGTSYDLIICLTSQSMTRSTDEIDSATKCGPDKQPGAQTQQITFEGQIMWDADTDRVSEAALHTLWKNSTTVGWKLGKTTPVADDVTYSGTGFISSLEATYDLDNPASFSGTLGIYGDITQTITE